MRGAWIIHDAGTQRRDRLPSTRGGSQRGRSESGEWGGHSRPGLPSTGTQSGDICYRKHHVDYFALTKGSVRRMELGVVVVHGGQEKEGEGWGGGEDMKVGFRFRNDHRYLAKLFRFLSHPQ